MANMFLNKSKSILFKSLILLVLFFIVGLIIFYVCISLYLFGDLAIYGSAVPKSIRDVIWFVKLSYEKIKSCFFVIFKFQCMSFKE